MIVGYGTVWRFFEREAITLEKKACGQPSKSSLPWPQLGLRWQDEQSRLDPAKLVFVDEKGRSLDQNGSSLWPGQARSPRRVRAAFFPWGR